MLPLSCALSTQAAAKDPSMIKGAWILMIETDYVWHKPVQAPPADSNAKSIAFPFGYIQPQNPSEFTSAGGSSCLIAHVIVYYVRLQGLEGEGRECR